MNDHLINGVAARHTVIPAVHIFLMKAGRLLLARRHNTGYEDGNYSVPAGHVEANETSPQAAVREALEEVGVKIEPGELELGHLMSRYSPEANKKYLEAYPDRVFDERIDFFWVAKRWRGEPQIMEPDKCDELKWVSPDDLPTNIIPYIRAAIEYQQAGQLYSAFGYEVLLK